MKDDKTKHKYLVGYVGDKQCVYGKDNKEHGVSWVDPMTLAQAHYLAAKHMQKTHAVRIYKIVPLAHFEFPTRFNSKRNRTWKRNSRLAGEGL